MLTLGVTIMALATVTIGASTYLEWKRREPIYNLLMKVGAAFLAIGGVMFGVAMGT